MTRRPTLADFSPEVLASDIQGQKLEANKHFAYDDHRRLLAAPAEDRAARIAKIANNEVVAAYDDHDSMVRAAANRCHDMKDACDLHYNNSRAIRQKALADLSKTLLKDERAILKRKALALVEAHAADVDHQELKDYLIGQGGLVGICLTDSAKVLGHPTDRSSDLAILLREFVSLGVLDKMPLELT